MNLTREGTAAWIRWSRPERLNAFDPEALHLLGDLLAEAASTDARTIVCFGEGGAFSSGDDLRETAAMDQAEGRTLEAFNRLTREIVAAPQPVIAAVDGVCVGGAFEFAFACDIRVASGCASPRKWRSASPFPTASRCSRRARRAGSCSPAS